MCFTFSVRGSLAFFRSLVDDEMPVAFCRVFNTLACTFWIAAPIMLVEIFLVRFLYTNVWTNVSLTYDAFWTNFLRVFNLCLTIYTATICIVSNNRAFMLDLAICMRKDIDEVDAIIGWQVIIHVISKTHIARYSQNYHSHAKTRKLSQ